MADFCGGAGEGNRTLVVSLEGLGSPRFSAVYGIFTLIKSAINWRFLVSDLILLPQVYRTLSTEGMKQNDRAISRLYNQF
jgi:hypothetical protein